MARRDTQTVAGVHEVLRRRIISGEHPPDAPLSQLRIAEHLGISRTPLREAFRLLEQEGLVVAEHNRRFRVAGFSADDLDELYAQRITVEAFAARVGIPLLTDDDLAAAGDLMRKMDEASLAEDYEAWNTPHIDFHSLLLTRSGRRNVELTRRLSDHAERYRYASTRPHHRSPWDLASTEHRAMLETARVRDGEGTAGHLAAHFGRVALSVLSVAAPDHGARQVRLALSATSARSESSSC